MNEPWGIISAVPVITRAELGGELMAIRSGCGLIELTNEQNRRSIPVEREDPRLLGCRRVCEKVRFLLRRVG